MKIADEWRPVYITLAGTLLIIAALASIDPKIAVPMIKDDGLIQIMTVVVLCACVLIALLYAGMKTPPVLQWAEASYILCIYWMREMDFHRIFTAEHVTRLKFYTGPFPLEQKLIGGTVMVFFIAVLLHFAATNARLFLKGLMDKTPWAWYLVAWGCLLVGAQIIDKPRLLRGLLKTLAEESFELGAAIMMLFVLLSFPLDLKKIFTLRQDTLFNIKKF